MITHVALLKFKPGTGDAEIRALEALLDDLPNQITEIQMCEFGRDIVHAARSYDFALVSLFANRPALERYQAHSAHQPVVEKIKALCADVITVDFPGPDSGSLSAGPPEWERDPLARTRL
jgi:hypothetical protein